MEKNNSIPQVKGVQKVSHEEQNCNFMIHIYKKVGWLKEYFFLGKIPPYVQFLF